ncbi:MAG TPA: L-threonylcarbamoyladenylate synthase [Terriglobales bacterium]|jgi:L-threonylcarbamoyladenylate synthase
MPETQRLHVELADASVYHPYIIKAAQMLRDGKLVAFPTETVYGLGANALDPDAVARIFEAKGRPAWDPIIVHVSDAEMAHSLMVDVTETFERLQREFWPGALTLLVQKNDRIPDIVTAGRRTVGVRMPSHATAHQLIRAAGIPIAAPSANLFSHTSPTTALHVMHDLNGRIDAVIDSGRSTIGVESTVLDITQSPPVIYRPGGVTREQIEAVIGPVVEFTHKEEMATEPLSMPAPGVGVRHYAPHAKLIVVEGGLKELVASTRAQSLEPNEIGVLVPTDWKVPELEPSLLFPWGAWGNWDQLAERLFIALRYLDERGVKMILAPLPGDDGVGAALRDRLRKAAR